MRYSNKRNYSYPVLRPYSRDYGDSAAFSTQLEPPVVDEAAGTLILRLSYNVNVGSMNRLLDSGEAICAAMLYCPATLYREFLQADAGSVDLSCQVPLNGLSGAIEIHPTIIANADFKHGFDGKLDDYGERQWQVQRGKPLATDQTWHLALEPKDLESTESIFNFVRDDDVPAGQIQVRANVGDRYIDILANPRTHDRLQMLRDSGIDVAIVSVFIGPLMEALMALQDLEEDDYSEDETGWVAALRAKLSSLGLLSLADVSLFDVAQQLFEYPYGRLVTPTPTNEES